MPARRPIVVAAPWSDIIAAAMASDDEHVIKLVHGCAVQNATAADDAWLLAAVCRRRGCGRW
ncbi:MAG: hypothetical protein ABIO71_03910 [Caldimonas sp.]